ncbi:MAG: ATP-binding cassette domain-containing protein [Actinomycetia bacterium]|nr:ATP-binding cassette domain-containing protein [Actinomycetes bacterium]
MAKVNDVVLVADAVSLEYPLTRGIIRRKQIGAVRAVAGVSLQLRRGETLALVGESGSGKSTLARLLIGLQTPTSGSIEVAGDNLAQLSSGQLRAKRRNIQLILQDPYTSLNPRMTLKAIIGEPFQIHRDRLPLGKSRTEAVAELMATVGLNPELINRYPHEFSGGQRQRIGIARALALRPNIIIADEPVSALDVSIQAQIINLMLDLRDSHQLSYVFVSHDLAVVRQIADRIAVMYQGRIVEAGPAAAIYASPQHPYTLQLLAAVPSRDRDRSQQPGQPQTVVPDDPSSPEGCSFRSRCGKATDLCGAVRPELSDTGAGHEVACHFPGSDSAAAPDQDPAP